MKVSLRERLRWHWFYKVKLPRYLRRIRPGDVVIDAGANVGVYTLEFARRGAEVYAFEPHPDAFAQLRLAARDLPNVTCIAKAVWDRNGKADLYFHAEGRGLPWSHSASLIAAKDNVDAASFAGVETVRLADFIAGVGRVRFLKMDIEGAEYAVLRDLIESGHHREVERIAVETHERSPALQEEHRALLRLLRRHRVRNVDLGWI
ncbi:MAG: FkbM family methyltransferase [Alphaproteobacteria bacterium]|nr:MAG: FkbM family methyltransferase [Alphaproteobacteria bacterium]